MSLIKPIKTDEQLMAAAARGSEKAFATLYDRYARRLQGFFFRQLHGDSETAADCTHDVFLRAYAARSTWREGSKVDVWLFTIAYNICRNIYRHSTYEAVFSASIHTDEADMPTTDTQIDDSLMREALQKTLDSLAPPQRMLFALHYEEELTVPEMASILGVAEGTVKSRLHTTMNIIKHKLRHYADK